MKQEYQLLYCSMLQDIESCMQHNLPEKEKAESCFWLTNNYWKRLRELVKDKKFKDDDEEIDFFRNVKPQFTCYIEYFVLLSSALEFMPGEECSQSEYWKDEIKKCERFSVKHHDFIHYYESGAGNMDTIYFKRVTEGQFKILRSVTYDSEPGFCSAQDAVVRSYLAHKKYREYVKGRIQDLTLNDLRSQPSSSNDESVAPKERDLPS